MSCGNRTRTSKNSFAHQRLVLMFTMQWAAKHSSSRRRREFETKRVTDTSPSEFLGVFLERTLEEEVLPERVHC